jgi:3'-phosphoadenosine 5'-phosphosulfate sulfotransferase (PAPS reductase)/FAD synthetase
MKKYLSFGGGVNSVAMMLMLLDQKAEFEAIFVDHGTDWPKTYEYFEMFQDWLDVNGHKPITVLKPDISGFSNLYDYCFNYKITPSGIKRWCTTRFKIEVIHKYVERPCFMLMGIDSGEEHRAKISMEDGIEKRYPLIEHEVDRYGCEKIIRSHGLPLPKKSGCYICPYMRRSQWQELRRVHPDLFCRAENLERMASERRISKGKNAITIAASGKSLSAIIDDQPNLFEADDYPPCECGL